MPAYGLLPIRKHRALCSRYPRNGAICLLSVRIVQRAAIHLIKASSHSAARGTMPDIQSVSGLTGLFFSAAQYVGSLPLRCRSCIMLLYAGSAVHCCCGSICGLTAIALQVMHNAALCRLCCNLSLRPNLWTHCHCAAGQAQYCIIPAPSHSVSAANQDDAAHSAACAQGKFCRTDRQSLLCGHNVRRAARRPPRHRPSNRPHRYGCHR